jgi:quinol monooxygenase YgiN
MSVNVIVEFKTKAGHSDELIRLLRQLMAENLEYSGVEVINIRQNLDDPNNIVCFQRWKSREAYLDHLKWRVDEVATSRIKALLTTPIVVRFFSDVLSGRGSSSNLPSRGKDVKTSWKAP